MVLPSDLCIKQENEVQEHETSSGTKYDIKIKLEIESSQVYDETDWCIDNKTLFRTNEECEQSTNVLDYEKLTEYFKHECLFCKKIFSNKYSLICHNLTHLKLLVIPIKTQNVCSIPCNDNNSFLIEHIQRNKSCRKQKNIEDIEFKKTTSLQQCNHCDKILPYRSWHLHQREVHGMDKYECVECKKQFKTERILKRHHMYVHLGQKRYPHKVFPLGETFKCSECPSEFDHKTKLTLHIRFCHCEKVRCKICMSVMKKNNLSNHMRRLHHSGPKHACHCHCGKKFKSPSYLKVHVKYAHTPSSS